MEIASLNSGDLLICDPCYITNVLLDGKQRFDALKLVRVLHEGDDGLYKVGYGNDQLTNFGEIGVDSGRIWILEAEFNVEVYLDSGFSGHIVLDSKHSSDFKDIDKFCIKR